MHFDRPEKEQEYDSYVVKRFALFPIVTDKSIHWLEWVYLYKEAYWDWRMRCIMWSTKDAPKEIYEEYKKLSGESGKKYISGNPPPRPDHGELD